MSTLADTTTQVEKILKTVSGNTFFSVTFRKRSNPDEIRQMTCRFGVSKGVTGKGRRFEANEKGLISVYDVKNGFRMIPIEGIMEIAIKGKTYHISN